MAAINVSAFTKRAPGVYVQEVPSGTAPIVGVGTSTAVFIGVVPDTIIIPTSPLIRKSTSVKTDKAKNIYDIGDKPVSSKGISVVVNGSLDPTATLTEEGLLTLSKKPAKDNDDIVCTYFLCANQITNELLARGDGSTKDFKLKKYPVRQISEIRVNGVKDTTNPSLNNDSKEKISTITFATAPALGATVTVDYQASFPEMTPTATKNAVLCTNFGEFKSSFGDFSTSSTQNQLAHAVYGFFSNGGTRCYVISVSSEAGIDATLLEQLEAIDEISLVVAPGITSTAIRNAIITHCQQATGDRFAIFDCAADDTVQGVSAKLPASSDYAAFYFPWIQVFDPAAKAMNPQGDGLVNMPPSGHIAGIYARVDTQRGVHKAPANEVIFGATGVAANVSKNHQAGLNPLGVNCIRDMNGNVRVWGARTIGEQNGEFTYINVRRLFLFLKESIDEGTQWTVFEPNSPELWSRIRRNVNAFLLTVWRSGALFGDTPEQAFYVKCDEETNPPENRDLGVVVIEIGVAVVKPAEFVVFNLSQWAGAGK